MTIFSRYEITYNGCFSIMCHNYTILFQVVHLKIECATSSHLLDKPKVDFFFLFKKKFHFML
jgi:hypothetical protein